MFTCTERSGPLTPQVNCFHCVSETEWCGDVFFFFSKIYLQECNCSYTLSVHLFPWDHKHTDPQTQSSQIVRNSCHFQVSNQRYLSQTWQGSRFVSWACLLSGGRGFLETSIEFISCVCWGNTDNLSSLKEVKQPYDTEACCLTPVLI